MIYVGLHAEDLILDNQWADLKPMLENLIYPLKGFKFNLSSEPYYYCSNESKDIAKRVFKKLLALRPRRTKISCAIPIKNPNGSFIQRLDDALKMIDYLLDLMGQEPCWWLINEPYNYKITYEQIIVLIKIMELAILRRTPKRELYLGDCPDEWEKKGWYELKNRKGKLFPKCVHFGLTMPLEQGYVSTIRNSRLLRSGCKVVCDECAVYDFETQPEYEYFRAWENPAHNWRRAMTALAGNLFNDFCWWPLFFHTNQVGQSIGLMANTRDKKHPVINPILKYFVKPPLGFGTG